MIISASRRTDIPALYPQWFVNRLLAGEVLVPNPYNRKRWRASGFHRMWWIALCFGRRIRNLCFPI